MAARRAGRNLRAGPSWLQSGAIAIAGLKAALDAQARAQVHDEPSTNKQEDDQHHRCGEVLPHTRAVFLDDGIPRIRGGVGVSWSRRRGSSFEGDDMRTRSILPDAPLAVILLRVPSSHGVAVAQ